MSISDRILRYKEGDGAAAGRPSLGISDRRSTNAASEGFRNLKAKVLNKLLETVDASKIDTLETSVVSSRLTSAINQLVDEEDRLLTDRDRVRMIEEIKNEILGLGPLEPLFRDDEINDVLVNGYKHVYVEKFGKLYETDISFRDDQHLLHVIERIVSRIGRRVDEASPMVDARLPDGSRVNAIIPPLALDGPALSIRRFGRDRLTIEDLVKLGSVTDEMVDFLRGLVRARLNIMVCGGTGSGKTTLLNCLSAFIPSDERIVTIEDSAELVLQQPHVVRLETRPPNLEGKGEITQRDLVRNSLRMRPDRIIVGEVRGPEVLDMLQAMSTGHDGSIATVHANNPVESLQRLELLMLLSGISLPERAMRQQISSAINVFVHVSRLSDGSRKIVRISEVTGMEGNTVMMQDLYEFARTGTGPQGEVQGNLRSTGIRSIFSKQLELAGYNLNVKQLLRVR